MRRSIILITLLLLAASAALADTITVPGDHATIQAAIDAASPGDVIEIACGTYNETLRIQISNLTLRGTAEDATCVRVDAGGLRAVRALDLYGWDTPLSGIVVENMSFTGGTHNAAAAWYATAVFTRCRFHDIDGADWGAGFRASYAPSQVTFHDCHFLDNSTTQGGGGIYAGEGATPIEFHGCTFFGNSAGESGGGAYMAGVNALFSNCTLSENSSSSDMYPGGGIGAGYDANLTLRHTIIAASGDGQAVDMTGSGAVDATCCDLFGNADGDFVEQLELQIGEDGNFSLDPEFCGVAGNYNLELQDDSPCTDAHHPDGAGTCGLIGALGIGCVETPVGRASWSAVKTLY